jgi:hypothetical protein
MAKAVWGAYEYTFAVNLLEVYNENIHDLLVSKVTTGQVGWVPKPLTVIDFCCVVKTVVPPCRNPSRSGTT